MKKNITILLLLIFNIAICQDSHLVKATTNTDAVIGKISITGCGLSVDEILKPNTKLTLYGYIYCNDKEQFYKVYHNGLYFIKKSEVNISNNDDLYLKSLTREQDNALGQEITILSKKNLDSIKKADEIIKIKYLEIGVKNGLLIGKSNVFDQSEYTDGTGYSFTAINTSKKTIKYIWVTVKGINPVNDVVSSKTVKCVGPLEPNNEGNYTFDYTWYSDIVESCKITSIKIQYMDGSIKQLANPESLVLSKSLYEIMFGSE